MTATRTRAPRVMGHQMATTRMIPRGTGDDTSVRIAEALGFSLLPWQAEVLTMSASTGRGGLWSAFENVVIAPRQQGKSFVVVPRALAGALIYGERLVMYSAHELRTAQETWLLMREACNHEAIAPFVKRIHASSGRESVEFVNGARFKVISRSRAAGRGFSADCLLMDEAFALTGDVMGSMLPSLAARPNPQVYYFSSAGTWESEILMNLRRRGHAKTASRLAYWEWHADRDADVHDELAWAAANPSYGVLLKRPTIEREIEAMSTRAFRRERLGIWTESFAETAMGEEDVHACAVDVPPAPVDGRALAFGVDVASDRSTSAITAAFRGEDGLPVVVLLESRPGAGWLPERLGEFSARFGGCEGFAYDAKGGILDIMDRAARDYDVPLVPLRYADYPAACAGFTQAVADHRIHIGRSPDLIRDAVNATARAVSNGWVWDRKVTTPPIGLISATCALYALDHGTGSSSVAVY